VNQEDLKYVHPAAREAAGGARTALGSDYELQLRSEAGPAPAKLAKRKHQISSLYHHAKIRVSGLDMHLDLRCLDQLFVLTQHACAVLSLLYLAYRQNLRSCPSSGLCVCLRCTRKARLLCNHAGKLFHTYPRRMFSLKLFYIAQELELLEQRGQGIKTKAETQAKYGW